MIKRRLVLFFSVLLIAVSCSRPLTDTDNGSTIELTEDDGFQLVLQGEGFPEYNWQIVSANNHIKLSEPITAESNGSITDFEFNFETVGTGEDKLRLAYTNGKDTKKTFELTVIVGTMGRIESY
ncbi:hypothetical protein [Zobellia uliginosa]|uniref:hypothetical protein n=1 Tax=Zobellia uliginosa TaxID=143224 RepID=UPI001C065CAD|nr:hypothetical protein [Zobellia uliginosa]MBU2945884.1 hypothetical protein [Zobellia uliginosa]